MIRTVSDRGTEDIFNRRRTKQARATCPPSIWRVAQRKLDQLSAAVSLGSMALPPGNKLEVLRGEREGQHSIRINEQYRVCFVWTDEGPEWAEIVDYH